MFYRIEIVVLLLLMIMPAALAKTILYVPFDDRPVSLSYPIDTVKAAKFDILTPPVEYLASRGKSGDSEQLWRWVMDNAGKADALVLSADALTYGGLVDSRTHHFNQILLEWSLRRFNVLHGQNPKVPIYVFSTIMRSPSASAGGVEPLYYEKYGPSIFWLTALQDKEEVKGLTAEETAVMQAAKDNIPSEDLKDWLERRNKNFQINAQLIDLTRQGVIQYLVLGRDDTSPFSQSHKEGRELGKLAAGLSADQYRSFPGADQLGMILLARAYNHLIAQVPSVEIRYMLGMAEATIPSYEDQPFGGTLADHVVAAGGKIRTAEKKTDLILAVNTPINGHTAEAGMVGNIPYVTGAMHSFVSDIDNEIKNGSSVAIADIAFANGADNSLMREMYEHKLLDKVSAYSGWNTASNTLGYAIGQGMMAKTMNDTGRKRVLAVRYLDDWAYQANIRADLYKNIVYSQQGIEEDIARMDPELTLELTKEMKSFVTKYLWFSPDKMKVSFPWNRLFEIKVEMK